MIDPADTANSCSALCNGRSTRPRSRRGGGSITKQGSRLVRWAAIEASSHGGGKIRSDHRRIAERRGRNIGRVAAARKTLRLVYYGLRDGGRSAALPRLRRAEPSSDAASSRLGVRHDPDQRVVLTVIEHCWLRRIAPCRTGDGSGEDMSRQPSCGLA